MNSQRIVATDVFQKNMLDRYFDRLDMCYQNGKYAIIDSLCFSEFLSYYQLAKKSPGLNSNDLQPVVLDDGLMDKKS